MSKYLMTLTPQEPYFFGNEKSFLYPGVDTGTSGSRYFIKSELTPAQTTLLGSLRYILLPKKGYAHTQEKENTDVVGEKSFKYGETNTFGKILGLSPLFLLKDGAEKLVVTPFDHIKGEKKYTPFSVYATTEDGRLFPTEYKAKDGISHSYMSVENGRIYELDAIFKKETRVGINRSATDKGFFKKEYANLLDGFSFATYVTLSDDITPKDAVVFMGQGKSLFTVKFNEADDKADKELSDAIAKRLRKGVFYCFGDAFLCMGNAIYKNASFAVTGTRDYRAYTTRGGKVTKGSTLYKLLSAGSIFVSEKMDFAECFHDPTVEIVGYNTVITNTGDQS